MWTLTTPSPLFLKQVNKSEQQMLNLYAWTYIHCAHIYLFEICLKLLPSVLNKLKQHFLQKQTFIKEHILSIINNTDIYIDPKLLKQRRPKKTVKTFESQILN